MSERGLAAQAPAPGESVDYLPYAELPSAKVIVPTHDFGPIKRLLPQPETRKDRGPVSGRTIMDLRPSFEPITVEDVGIDFKSMLETMHQPENVSGFLSIVRGGKAFDIYGDTSTVAGMNEKANFAMSVMSLDASLKFHGIESMRRMNKFVVMQQLLHTFVFADLLATYGNSKATVTAYEAFSKLVRLPTAEDIKYAALCAFLHDFGEPETGDEPLGLKVETGRKAEDRARRLRSHIEQAECLRLANELYAVRYDDQYEPLVTERVEMEGQYDPERLAVIKRFAGAKQSSYEISQAIIGTEIKDSDDTVRSALFNGGELVEYDMSGIREHETVKYNFGDVKGKGLDRRLASLSVDTVLRNLPSTLWYADRFIGIYDFMRQNRGRYHANSAEVINNIQHHAGHSPRGSRGFDFDPFLIKSWGEVNSPREVEQLKRQYIGAVVTWKRWDRQRTHLMRTLWETYFGTRHEQTRNSVDVSFAQYTEQNLPPGRYQPDDMVRVQKPLTDMYGNGLVAV